MARRRQERLDLVPRVSFEPTRLSRWHLADAYEQLVSVPRRRLAMHAEGAMHDDPARTRLHPGQARRQTC